MMAGWLTGAAFERPVNRCDRASVDGKSALAPCFQRPASDTGRQQQPIQPGAGITCRRFLFCPLCLVCPLVSKPLDTSKLLAENGLCVVCPEIQKMIN
jgi:hypothetical protein